MITWFEEREQREQLLLGALGFLLLVFGAWFLVISPILGAHEKAENRQQNEIRNFQIVSKAIPQLSASGPAVASQPFSRNVLIDTARVSDIPLSRVQPQGTDNLTVWIDNTNSPALYGFINTLVMEKGAVINRVTINAGDGGAVSAQISFKVG